jgi:hypothetical protein
MAAPDDGRHQDLVQHMARVAGEGLRDAYMADCPDWTSASRDSFRKVPC